MGFDRDAKALVLSSRRWLRAARGMVAVVLADRRAIPDPPTGTVATVTAIMASRGDPWSDTVPEFLKALLAYWEPLVTLPNARSTGRRRKVTN